MVDSHQPRDTPASEASAHDLGTGDLSGSTARRDEPAAGAAVDYAVATIRTEAIALEQLAACFAETGLGDAFCRTTGAILAAKGRVVVSGMGKSGLIGRKIAATLSSTGTPAFFIHPAEAGHGDLGMITPDDIMIILSWSGETKIGRAHV